MSRSFLGRTSTKELTENGQTGGAALARLSAPDARVVRGGRSFLIPAAELVPGDLAEVARGDRVPADLRLCRSHRLVVNESTLTGVALPVGKEAGKALPERTSLADRSNMLYAGTHIAAGRGRAAVVATGLDTEVGPIATLTAAATEPRTPLELRFAQFARWLVLFAVALFAVILAFGIARGLPFGDVLIS